ncbi:uncharacterized protein LOC131070106 [Cryptomeria japonica]|uniref:uncharacterized protein LOC131070106 n=1 Tax=Cryptomeria japonica TaxID=3369 RepID=UPI0025AD3F3A|nr:uncharacterized protein LOC131070106 [Cryptomeria japonica]
MKTATTFRDDPKQQKADAILLSKDCVTYQEMIWNFRYCRYFKICWICARFIPESFWQIRVSEMKKERVYWNGYLITRDPQTHKIQIIRDFPPPPRRGNVKRGIFNSLVAGTTAVVSDVFCYHRRCSFCLSRNSMTYLSAGTP